MSDFVFDLPPSASGSAEQQLVEVRNYLFRMVRQLNTAASETTSAAVVSSSRNGVVMGSSGSSSATQEAIQQQVTPLRELILKTANNVKAYADEINTKLESNYIAESDFGKYKQEVSREIIERAENTVDNYFKTSDVYTTLKKEVTNIQGQIQRGFIEVDGEPKFGIAISNNLSVTSEERTEDDKVYKKISDNQSFGLYTAEGWMFFLDGVRVGWFSSADGLLHVSDLTIENEFIMGSWKMAASANGWGIKYVGVTNGTGI